MTNGNSGDGAPMGPEQFAAYIERRLTLEDDAVEVLGREGVVLRLRVRGQEVTSDLTNIYAAYRTNPSQIDAVARSYVRVLLGELPDRSERDFAALAGRVMPMLKPIELLVAVRERKLPMLAYRPFLADLIITYVIDEKSSVAFINEEQLDRWGVAAQDLHNLAVENLRRRTREGVRYTAVGEGEERLFIYSSGDGYDATRLLLTEVLAEWARAVQGRLVVGIPNRDFLIALGDANQDILRAVAAQVQADATQREHGLTDQLFTLAGGAVREYEWE
ncbi:MAG TPA: DUF1444 family protein [Roseiflexaceae bacterium]|nr:DUF1444 family protein [Roseiflexaceae bacterium]